MIHVSNLYSIQIRFAHGIDETPAMIIVILFIGGERVIRDAVISKYIQLVPLRIDIYPTRYNLPNIYTTHTM